MMDARTMNSDANQERANKKEDVLRIAFLKSGSQMVKKIALMVLMRLLQVLCLGVNVMATYLRPTTAQKQASANMMEAKDFSAMLMRIRVNVVRMNLQDIQSIA